MKNSQMKWNIFSRVLQTFLSFEEACEKNVKYVSPPVRSFLKLSVEMFFLNMGHPRPLFHLFCEQFKQQYNFYDK